jgi:hypothetical protein
MGKEREIVKSESMPGSSALFTSKELTVVCTKRTLFVKARKGFNTVCIDITRR